MRRRELRLGSTWAATGAAIVVGMACGEPSRSPDAKVSDVGSLPTAPGEVEFSAGPGSGEASLAVTPDGRLLLTWHEPGAEGQALRLAIRSPEGWGEVRTVREDVPFFVNWADFPSAVAFRDGTLAVHWLEKVASSTYAYHVKVALSHDGGLTWSEPIVPHRDAAPTEHGFVSMIPWGDRVALVWLDGRKMADEEAEADGHGDTGAMQIRFTTLGADGSVGEEVLLDARTCECCQTALVRVGEDLVAAYRDRSPEEVRDIYRVRRTGGEWGAPGPVARDGWVQRGCPVNGPQLDATETGEVVAAWYTAGGGTPAVQAAFSDDAGESFGVPVRVDLGAPAGRVDVLMVERGRAVIVWLETREDGAALLLRSVEASGRTGQVFRVSSTSGARASGFPRLARVGENLYAAWRLPGPEGGVRVRRIPLDALP